MAAPAVQHTTLVAIGRQMGLSLDELDHAWRTTPVPVMARKAGPSTDPARRFTAACQASALPRPRGCGGCGCG